MHQHPGGWRAASVTLLLIGSAVTVLEAGPAAPTGVAATCHGEPVTLVGSDRAVLQGTEVRDVIVTNGAREVHAGAGDDLICVTGARQTYVYAEAGDDLVTTLRLPSGVRLASVYLGVGADRFLGGPGADFVHADELSSGIVDDDVVFTGAGPDTVVMGDFDLRDQDVVRLGPGDDTAFPHGDGARIHGGPGRDTLDKNALSPWRFDNRVGEASEGGVVRFSWDSLERFSFFALSGTVTFRGSDRDEFVQAHDPPGEPTGYDVQMGGGSDHVDVDNAVLALSDSRFRLGTGRDTLQITDLADADLDGAFHVRLDLGEVWLRHAGQVRRTPVSSAEDFLGSFLDDVSVVGTAGPNRIEFEQHCRARVQGLGGADVIVARSTWFDPACRQVFRGGDGNDVLVGAGQDDRLLGGPGRDVARGRGGTDVCWAERTYGC